MENIIRSISQLFNQYGFQAALIIIATVIFTNLIKGPIVKRAVAYAEKTGYDKAVITKNITFIPVGVAFILVVLVNLILVKFNFAALDWSEIASTSVVYASVAIATYESVKKQLEAYASKKNNTVAVIENTNTNSEDTEAKENTEVLE